MVGDWSLLTLLVKTESPMAANNTGLLFLLIEAGRVSGSWQNELSWGNLRRKKVPIVGKNHRRFYESQQGFPDPQMKGRGSAPEPELSPAQITQLARISRCDLISHPV